MSQVKHELTGSEYPDRVRQCKEATATIKESYPEVELLRDATMPMLEAVVADMDEVVYRRAKHVIAENYRVVMAGEALRSQSFQEVGNLMVASHNSLRDDFEVRGKEGSPWICPYLASMSLFHWHCPCSTGTVPAPAPPVSFGPLSQVLYPTTRHPSSIILRHPSLSKPGTMIQHDFGDERGQMPCHSWDSPMFNTTSHHRPHSPARSYSVLLGRQVSAKELDILVDLAMSFPGAQGTVYGSRMTGGGFGGCTVTLVAASAADVSTRVSSL